MMPLLSEEATSEAVGGLLREDREIAAWWGTTVECAVAISRLVREGVLDDNDEVAVRVALGLFADSWTEVGPTDDRRSSATVLSRDHPLKAADALQLAAALRWCEGDTRNKGFVCLDNRLRRAARDEGFDVMPEPMETG